jgi:tricorn protease
MAADIFIFNLESKASENITNNVAGDEIPMWAGNKIYFLSDRGENKRNNIWSYDLSNKQTKQVTNFDKFDIRFPSIGNNEIVFEAGGLLYLLDLTTEKYQEVKINVVTDESTLLARNENVEKLIQNSISYNETRYLKQRRNIFSSNGKWTSYKSPQSSGVAERYPAYSPNGKYAAYFSDRSVNMN